MRLKLLSSLLAMAKFSCRVLGCGIVGVVDITIGLWSNCTLQNMEFSRVFDIMKPGTTVIPRNAKIGMFDQGDYEACS
ncbi:hypothetical protein RchiOBHm_Chr7g0209981 [Rosa chinensis]|uniref:Uncharacterized protein n=1 Tax=Rosa chinensis TaxID=74649 RepID=A0A2P6PA40_ROSCH|nr:hypothetical protein RchiOBHm_Chr7g0209981 [Rosa chinensis]